MPTSVHAPLPFNGTLSWGSDAKSKVDTKPITRPPPRLPGRLVRSTELVGVRGRVHDVLSDDDDVQEGEGKRKAKAKEEDKAKGGKAAEGVAGSSSSTEKKARRTSFAGFSTLQRAASSLTAPLTRSLSRTGSFSKRSSTPTPSSGSGSGSNSAITITTSTSAPTATSIDTNFKAGHRRSASASGSISKRRSIYDRVLRGRSGDQLPATIVESPILGDSIPPTPIGAYPSTPHAFTARRKSSSGPKIMADISIPQLLREGTPMTKVSAKKQKRIVLRLDPDQGKLVYQGKQLRNIPLEYIKELRTGPEARYYREQFGVSYTHESCWMSIVYMYDGEYKTLHLLATTKDLFRLWEDSIRKLMAVRKEMLMGLSDGAVREEVWARQHWADADSEDRDERLAFDEVEKMCRKMNVNASKDKLKSLFTQADSNNLGYLDFAAFQRFVKLLKRRPEIDRLYRKVRILSGPEGSSSTSSDPKASSSVVPASTTSASNQLNQPASTSNTSNTINTPNLLSYPAFHTFIRTVQKETWDDAEIERVFRKYATALAAATPSARTIDLPEVPELGRSPDATPYPSPSPLAPGQGKEGGKEVDPMESAGASVAAAPVNSNSNSNLEVEEKDGFMVVTEDTPNAPDAPDGSVVEPAQKAAQTQTPEIISASKAPGAPKEGIAPDASGVSGASTTESTASTLGSTSSETAPAAPSTQPEKPAVSPASAAETASTSQPITTSESKSESKFESTSTPATSQAVPSTSTVSSTIVAPVVTALQNPKVQVIQPTPVDAPATSISSGSAPISNSAATATASQISASAAVPTSTPAAPYPPAIIQNAQAKASSGLSTAVSIESVPPPAPLSSLAITPSAFNSFLMSSSCAASTDTSAEITHDMTQPLCDYYISSSHNTYLVGHQLVGDSTIEGYIRALLHGCRSVELDVYDGEIEPCVTHGNTLTSRVPVRDIARAIAKYAFVASPYPIIISAEVHCNLAQQAFLAKILQEEFGEALVSAPIDGRPSISVLPSPEDLKGRVLLKAKNLYVTERDGLQEMKDKAVVVGQEESTTDTTDTSSQSESERGGEGSSGGGGVKGRVSNLFRKVRGKSPKPRADSAMPASGNTHGSGSVPRRSATEPLPKTKMSEDIVALLVYTVGVKCRGLNKKEVYAPEHMFSLSERTAGRVMKEGAMDLVKHTRGHLVRIYPKGIRVSSSNYHPHRFWAAGAQLVALNWQTSDLGTMINHAMFQRNGRAGYVLKPPALRQNGRELLQKHTRHFFDVRIISGQQLPRRRRMRDELIKTVIDPLVEVSLHVPDWTAAPFLPSTPAVDGAKYAPPEGPGAGGVASASLSPGSAAGTGMAPSTARVLSYKTAAVKNNGFNPVWEERCSLPFDCVGDMADLVFVRFAIRDDGDDDDDDPIAMFCCSLSSLRQGYRHLPLHDTQLSQYLFSTLFVHISVRDA